MKKTHNIEIVALPVSYIASSVDDICQCQKSSEDCFVLACLLLQKLSHQQKEATTNIFWKCPWKIFRFCRVKSLMPSLAKPKLFLFIVLLLWWFSFQEGKEWWMV